MTDEEERFEDYGEADDGESETESHASRPRTLRISSRYVSVLTLLATQISLRGS